MSRQNSRSLSVPSFTVHQFWSWKGTWSVNFSNIFSFLLLEQTDQGRGSEMVGRTWDTYPRSTSLSTRRFRARSQCLRVPLDRENWNGTLCILWPWVSGWECISPGFLLGERSFTKRAWRKRLGLGWISGAEDPKSKCHCPYHRLQKGYLFLLCYSYTPGIYKPPKYDVMLSLKTTKPSARSCKERSWRLFDSGPIPPWSVLKARPTVYKSGKIQEGIVRVS